jgi:centromere/kinetochore protein ZW10
VTRKVERVEKEMVSSKDDVLLEGGTTEDWDADWGHENEEDSNRAAPMHYADDEEDVSAWGLEDDSEDVGAGSEHRRADSAEDEEPGDAWGWGEDDDDQNPEEGQRGGATTAAKHENGHQKKRSSSPKEITLTEYYTVTDIPDSIVSLIRRQVSDSEALSKPE